MEKVKFKTDERGSCFYDDVKKQVNAYFESNKISSLANTEMRFKLIFWLAFWVASWVGVIYFKEYFFVAV